MHKHELVEILIKILLLITQQPSTVSPFRIIVSTNLATSTSSHYCILNLKVCDHNASLIARFQVSHTHVQYLQFNPSLGDKDLETILLRLTKLYQ